jgi:hypothetical protein
MKSNIHKPMSIFDSIEFGTPDRKFLGGRGPIFELLMR